MKVRLKNPWFSPSGKFNISRGPQNLSGRRFPAGEQEVPDYLMQFLPSSALVNGRKMGEIRKEEAAKAAEEAKVKAEQDARAEVEARQCAAEARAKAAEEAAVADAADAEARKIEAAASGDTQQPAGARKPRAG